MNSQTATTEKICSQRSEIVAFIDGELLPHEELEFELHLTVCGSCAAELNEQKKLLCALDYALENDGEIELPANFLSEQLSQLSFGKRRKIKCPPLTRTVKWSRTGLSLR